MKKVMLVTIALTTGRVINTKHIELDDFSVADVIEFGERCDYGFDNSRIEKIKAIPTPQHRSVEYINENLIVRYMDSYPQYYFRIND